MLTNPDDIAQLRRRLTDLGYLTLAAHRQGDRLMELWTGPRPCIVFSVFDDAGEVLGCEVFVSEPQAETLPAALAALGAAQPYPAAPPRPPWEGSDGLL